MTDFLHELFDSLSHHDNHVIIMTVYLSLILAAIILRVAAHLHFRGALLAFRLEARGEIKHQSDVASIKNGLLRKTVAEYIRIAERSVMGVSTGHLVNRAVGGMSLAGWKYENIIPFVEAMDGGLLLVGLVLAVVFGEHAFVYGVLAVCAFLLTRLTAAFFNARGAREQLADEMLIYIEREIGRFFASDAGGAVLRLKNELTDAIDRQTQTYKEALAAISKVMAGELKEVSKTHETLGEATERLATSGARLQSASDLLASHMQGHSNALSEHLLTLINAIETTKEGLETVAIGQKDIASQVAYLASNQRALDASLASYEASLQNLTQSLGDGLGAFINLHAQSSAKVVNDALKGNIDRIMSLQSQTGAGQ